MPHLASLSCETCKKYMHRNLYTDDVQQVKRNGQPVVLRQPPDCGPCPKKDVDLDLAARLYGEYRRGLLFGWPELSDWERDAFVLLAELDDEIKRQDLAESIARLFGEH